MANVETLKEMVKYVRLTTPYDTQLKIAQKLGCNNGYLSGMLNSKEKLTEKFLDNFIDKFNLKDFQKNKTKEFETTSPVKNAFDQKGCSVLLLPISAQGGSLSDFVVSVKGSDCETIISPIKDVDFAITVAGESMAPEYPSGSQILIKKIDEKIFIEWGKAYVLDTCNGCVVKIITQSKKDGYLKCLSINADQRRYAPFEVPINEVYGIYRVLLCMSLK